MVICIRQLIIMWVDLECTEGFLRIVSGDLPGPDRPRNM